MNKAKEAYPPGDFGIWIIIYIELITFAALFIGYAFARRLEVDVFNESQLLLDQRFGFVNTILLITASYFVVNAVETIKKPEHSRTFFFASSWLYGAMLMGIAFLVLKCIEFYDKFEQGINLSTNTFFMFYYILTMFHFLHVVLGVIILYIMYRKTKQGAYTNYNLRGLETGASYWHMVDLLWIILFPLVYIMR